MARKLARLATAVAVSLMASALAYTFGHGRVADPDVGKTYRVPFRTTDTNHALVRVRVNGKGPFNFLVDTGAPALYLGAETARAVGIKPNDDDFWTPVDRIDFEGGARLTNMKARVEDVFQLTGMNALGLPGARIDGILGFSALARFRITLDPTRDRMEWTRLDYDPEEPAAPKRIKGAQPPLDIQVMESLSSVAKVLAFLGGKQPEVKLVPRGFLGLGLEADPGGADDKAPSVRVASVVAGSPADKAGVQAGDVLVRLNDKRMFGPKAAHDAVAKVAPGATVALRVRRGGETIDLELTAAEGL